MRKESIRDFINTSESENVLEGLMMKLMMIKLMMIKMLFILNL